MTGAKQDYKRSFSGSIGAGMKSIFDSTHKYYILEHKNSSEYHKAGESQMIIVDQIEIGRSSNCQVRFDSSFTTVSRRHAAIIKEDENWKLVHLSTTNSTLLNGHKVQKEWYLKSGDEIQLSYDGPKLIFIIPSGKKAFVDSIPLSRRMSLLVNQVLRPYKTIMAIMTCLIIVLAGMGGYKLYELQMADRDIADKMEELSKKAKEQTEAIKQTNDNIAKLTDSIAANGEAISNAFRKLEELKNRKPQLIKQVINKTVSGGNADNNAINNCLPYVFYIETTGFELTYEDGTKTLLKAGQDSVPGWSGTGFLLSDGRFVTARHVTEGWYFLKNGSDNLLHWNLLANNGGKVVAHFGAISSSGEQFSFTSEDFQCNRKNDYEVYSENGERVVFAKLDFTDYAYINTNKRGSGLQYDSQKSNSLNLTQKLTVLGFPFGFGANSPDDINPIYSNAIVAVDGLQNGIILTTDSNFEQGNSGGPVFLTNDDGELEVIGIVSGGAGRNTGFVVPISVIN